MTLGGTGDLSVAGVLRFAQDDTSQNKGKSKSNGRSKGKPKVNYPTFAKDGQIWATRGMQLYGNCSGLK